MKLVFKRFFFLLGSISIVSGIGAQTIYKVPNKEVDIFFFSKQTANYLPRILSTHAKAVQLHNQLWNAATDSVKGAFHYQPQKSTLYLTDWEDYGNGGVNSIPYNMIQIGMAPMPSSYYVYPGGERFSNLFNHEQTHVVQADKYNKQDRNFRRFIGGKVAPDPEQPFSAFWSLYGSPRWYTPRWYHEGIACFLETWLSKGTGRAMGGYDEMYFRSIVKSHEKLYSVVGLETEGITQDFQVGSNSYLYGTRFVNYLAYTYGADSLFTFYNRTVGSKSRPTAQFKQTFGKPLKKVWNEWLTEEVKFQQQNLATIAQYPVTTTETLYQTPLGSCSSPLYDEKKGVIYLAVNHPGDFAHVLEINIQTQKSRKICEIESPMSYQVAYLALDSHRNQLYVTTYNRKFRGLKVIDIRTGKELKRKDFTRLGELVYHPQKERLYGVEINEGIASLVYYDRSLQTPHRLYSFPFGETWADVHLSHQGTKICGTLYGANSEQQLIEFDVEELDKLNFSYKVLHTIPRTNLGQFTYSLNDSLLMGSSYYTGVSNLWSLNPVTKEMKLLSNSLTGLFAPVQISPDSLVALQFERDGFLPVKLPIRPIEDANAIEYWGQRVYDKDSTILHLGTLDSIFIKKQQGVTYHTEALVYKPLRNLRFTGAYPSLSGYKKNVALDYTLHFQDYLGLNRLQLSLGLSPWSNYRKEEQFHINLKWNYYFWMFNASYNNTSFYDLFGKLKSSRKGYKIGGGYEYNNLLKDPFIKKWGVQLYTYGNMDALPLFQNVASPVSSLQTAEAYYEIKKERKSLGAVMPEKGYRVMLSGYSYYADRSLFPFVHLELDKGFLLPIHRNTSFWLRTSVGQSFGSSSSAFGNEYFGGFRNNLIDHKEPNQYQTVNAFPGVAIDDISAHSYVKATAELNLCPLRFKGVGGMSLYPTYAQLSLFSSELMANPWGKEVRKNYTNVGAQLNIQVMMFSYLKTTWSAGYAYLVQPSATNGSRGAWMFSLKLL